MYVRQGVEAQGGVIRQEGERGRRGASGSQIIQHVESCGVSLRLFGGKSCPSSHVLRGEFFPASGHVAEFLLDLHRR